MTCWRPRKRPLDHGPVCLPMVPCSPSQRAQPRALTRAPPCSRPTDRGDPVPHSAAAAEPQPARAPEPAAAGLRGHPSLLRLNFLLSRRWRPQRPFPRACAGTNAALSGRTYLSALASAGCDGLCGAQAAAPLRSTCTRSCTCIACLRTRAPMKVSHRAAPLTCAALVSCPHGCF